MKIYHFFKRIIDIIISLIGIIVLSPFFIIIAILIKLDSEGPVIYKHERVGKERRIFNIYKFRSMVVGARQIQEARKKGKKIWLKQVCTTK